MIPGMNPRAMRQAMKKLGIQQQDIEATEVIIKTKDKNLIIKNPQVAKVNMMGQETFQIVGEIEEQDIEKAPEISKEDIQTVAEQTGKTEEEAEQAITQHDGDLAAAILGLKSD
ncbi:MAG: nascent polypeptide-associated complex protein [Nanoarchaeota archaeon]|nr:nascent polypeptide-associated complex protein [Nanoarchaeota archaeon]MBU1004396.1 nascent polypeptide-associated complex protein [Nanoarchaeota archaeon]MBU1946717.1 nascent polypeptide-associated complex protein [Nanoarchaeota archaeon]